MLEFERIPRLLKAVHYQKVLYQLERSWLETPESPFPDDDLQSILQSQAWCAANSTKDKAAAALCSKFAGVAGHWVEQRLHRMEQMRWLEEGLVAAEILGNVEEQATHLNRLGFTHYMSGNIEKAEALCERSLKLSRQHEIRSAEGGALYLLGMCRMRQGQMEDARIKFESALSTLSGLNQQGVEANILNALALTYGHLEQHERALELFNRAVHSSRKSGFSPSEGIVLANRASALSALGRITEAGKDLERAMELANRLDDDHLRGLTLVKLAVLTTHSEGRNTRSMGLLEQALAAYQRAGDRLHELEILAGMERAVRSFLDRPGEQHSYAELSTALRKLGRIHALRHEHQKAHDVYGQLLDEARKAGDLSDQVEAWVQLGHSSVLLGEYERAVQENEEALAVLRALRSAKGPNAYPAAERELWSNLGQAQRHLGRPEESRKSYERARTIAAEMGDEEARWRAVGNLGLVYVDLREFDQALQTLARTHDFYGKSRNRPQQARALFNLAYAHQRKGDSMGARQIGMVASQLLEQIGDSSAEELRRQMATWQPGEEREEGKTGD